VAVLFDNEVAITDLDNKLISTKTKVEPSEKKLYRRFPLIALTAGIICFVIFPLLLVNTALEKYLQIEFNKTVLQKKALIESALDDLEVSSNNDHFFHQTLKDSFAGIIDKKDTTEEIKARIAGLKKAFPNSLSFVIWDQKGNPISELSDEQSYIFMLREAFRLFSEAADFHNRNIPLSIHSGSLNRRLKMLRNYIGRLVPIYRLSAPLMPERLGSTILAEAEGDKNRIWYSLGSEFSVMCFLHERLFSGPSGALMTMRKLLQNNPELEIGITGYPVEENSLISFKSTIPKSRLVISLNKFENMHPGDFLMFDQHILSYRFLTQKHRAFAALTLSEKELPETRRNFIIFNAFKAFMVLLFILHVYAKINPVDYIPVGLKLSALFVYAGGIPFLIAMILAADYLQQKREELIFSTQTAQLAIMRKIDSDFSDFQADYTKKIKNILKNAFSLDPVFFKDQRKLSEFAEELKTAVSIGGIMIFDQNGRSIFSKQDKVINDMTIFARLSEDAIKFLNLTDTADLILSEVSRPLASELLYNLGRIINMSFGVNRTYASYNLLRDSDFGKIHGIIFLFWKNSHLQNDYLTTKLVNYPELLAYSPQSASFIQKFEFSDSRPLRNLMEKTNSSIVVRSSSLWMNESFNVISAMRGTNLNEWIMAIKRPIHKIDIEINSLLATYLKLTIFYIFLAAGTVLLLRNRLLKPLDSLKNCVAAISGRNFRFRTDIEGRNEFGKLGKALNHTLETLQELETARAVQDNLLPGNSFRHNQFKLSAKMVQAAHIGGDYYDFFEIDGEVSGIFIGDVSGHGISSALFMAMARAAIIFENFAQPQPSSILNSINNIIRDARKSGNKEYMTGQVLFINTVNGKFRIQNAGHCPPVIVRNNGRAEIIKCCGLPLGFSDDTGSKEVLESLNHGEFLVLYTDNWVEAESAEGIPFGFDRFKKALETNKDNDPELFLKRMFETINKWELERKDDLTLIIAKLEQNS